MRPLSRVLGVLVAVCAMALGIAVAPPTSASCGYGEPVSLQNLFSSQTFAGVETTSRIPFVFRYSNAGCLQGMIFTFVGGGGVDVQAVRATVTTSGVSGEASANWVPKAMEYKLYVDVVYDFGYYSQQTSSRWTYNTVLSSGAFKPLPAPSAPTSVSLGANNRSLGIQWGAPASNGSAVIEYSVVRQQTGEIICKVPPSQFSCTIADVPDGVYSFVVRSRNSQGAGAEAGTNPVIVGPPSAPHFDQVLRVAKGKKLKLTWMNVPATTAVPTAFRVFDDTGKEVCGLPASDTSMGAEYACQVTLPPRGAAYTLKVESALGLAESEPTPRLIPRKGKGGRS